MGNPVSTIKLLPGVTLLPLKTSSVSTGLMGMVLGPPHIGFYQILYARDHKQNRNPNDGIEGYFCHFFDILHFMLLLNLAGSRTIKGFRLPSLLPYVFF